MVTVRNCSARKAAGWFGYAHRKVQDAVFAGLTPANAERRGRRLTYYDLCS